MRRGEGGVRRGEGGGRSEEGGGRSEEGTRRGEGSGREGESKSEVKGAGGRPQTHLGIIKSLPKASGVSHFPLIGVLQTTPQPAADRDANTR